MPHIPLQLQCQYKTARHNNHCNASGQVAMTDHLEGSKNDVVHPLMKSRASFLEDKLIAGSTQSHRGLICMTC